MTLGRASHWLWHLQYSEVSNLLECLLQSFEFRFYSPGRCGLLVILKVGEPATPDILGTQLFWQLPSSAVAANTPHTQRSQHCSAAHERVVLTAPSPTTAWIGTQQQSVCYCCCIKSFGGLRPGTFWVMKMKAW